jgi:hypothetical protein
MRKFEFLEAATQGKADRAIDYGYFLYQVELQEADKSATSSEPGRAAARQRAAIGGLALAVLARLGEEGFSLEKNQR